MREDIHQHAEHLLLKAAVEQLSPAEESRLSRHLGDCTACTQIAARLEEVVRSLRTMSVDVDASLVERTRRRVRARARDLMPRSRSTALLWAACAATWAWMAVSAPYVWRGFAWTGTHIGVSNWVWEMGFGLWWLFPALAVGTALVLHRSVGAAQGDGYVET